MFKYFIVLLTDAGLQRQFRIVEGLQLIHEAGVILEKNSRVFLKNNPGQEMYIVHGSSNLIYLVENYEDICHEYLEDERRAAEILLQFNREAVIFAEQQSEINSEKQVKKQMKLLDKKAQISDKFVQNFAYKSLDDDDIICLKDCDGVDFNELEFSSSTIIIEDSSDEDDIICIDD